RGCPLVNAELVEVVIGRDVFVRSHFLGRVVWFFELRLSWFRGSRVHATRQDRTRGCGSESCGSGSQELAAIVIQVFGCDFRILYFCWTLNQHWLDLRLS